MAQGSAPVVAARVLLEHGLAEDVIVGYVARTWALDVKHCNATIAAARFLLEREQDARRRVDAHHR